MRRRELLGALSAGGLTLSSGCISDIGAASDCSLLSQFGIQIVNWKPTQQSLQVSIQTQLLGRDMFSQSFDIPAFEQDHLPVVCADDVFPNLASLTVSTRYNGETYTYSWRVRCNYLVIIIPREGPPYFSADDSPTWPCTSGRIDG